MNTVYDINKGINRSIEFQGIKAQYIIYLAVGMVALLLVFSILYIIGFNIYICLCIIIPGGGAFVFYIQRFSKKYGEHGLVKKMAAAKLPDAIVSKSRKLFIALKQQPDEKE